MNNTESFVLYESVYKQFEILKKRNPAVATNFIEAIMEYGLYGVVPDEESDVWLYGFEQSITSIQRAKDRYIAAVENGSKGGRPPKNLNKDEVLQKKEELKTWKAVAKFYNISEDTLRKLRNTWETEEPEKPKNLNDNVNDNVNDNDNDKIKEREEERGAATPPATTEFSEIQKKAENAEIEEKTEIEETKAQEEPRRLEETTINQWDRSELGVIGEIDNEKDLIAYLEILFGDHLTSKVKSQLQVALKTMSAKQIARFYFYCDQKEHRKFLRGSEMTLGLLQFDDIKERANTYWTNLDNRKKQFAKDYNLWQLDQKEIIVKAPQNKPTKRRAYTKEEIEAMV